MIESIFLHPWVWILPALLVVFIALIILDILFDWSGGGIVAGGICTLIIAGIYFGLLLPPYDASFYQTYRITGQLESVESAFSGDEGTMSQVFIAEVEGVDLFVKSDDQRFRTLSAGDEVNLVCVKSFAYFQEPWYDCSFGGVR